VGSTAGKRPVGSKSGPGAPVTRAVGAVPAALVALLAVSPGGARGAQEVPPPVDLAAAYTLDLMANVRGGVRRGAVGLGNLDATALLDLEALAGWSGTSVFLYGLATHGAEPTELVGDVQVASNIEAPDGVRLYEAWIQQNFDGPNLSLLAGLYDVNSEFDVIEEALPFLHSSFGIGAEFGNSGVNGPSIFPVTSLGARIQWHPTHQLYLQGTVLDGVPGDPSDPAATAVHLSADEGVLWAAEVGFLEHSEPSATRGNPQVGRGHVHDGIPWRLGAGVWQYTRSSARIDGRGRVVGHPGAYLFAELRPGTGAERPERPLGLFARVGLADGRTNRFGAYTGGGITYEGVLPGRADDVVGLGVARAFNGDGYERALRERGEPVSSAETSVEITYRFRPLEQLQLQPDLQWISSPGTDPRRKSALMLGLRAIAIF